MIGRPNAYGEDAGERLLEHARYEGLEWVDLLDALESKQQRAKSDRASQILWLLQQRVLDHLEYLS